MKYITSLILLIFLLPGCQKECPEDIHLEGTIQLMQKSIASHPYTGKTQAVFINENEDTIRYSVIGFDTIRVIEQQLGKICSQKDTEASLNSKVESTGGLLTFIRTPTTNQVQTFQLSLSPRNLNQSDPVDTVLVDALLIYSYLYSETPTPGLSQTNNHMELITCERSNANNELLQSVKEEYLETITLGNLQFEQVYKSTGSFREIYYNFEKGILAFEDNADLWVLDRLE